MRAKHSINKPASSPRNYRSGTITVVAATIALILSDAGLASAKVDGNSGDSGTEYAGLLLAPVLWIGLAVLAAGLLSTALRRRPLPQAVRRVRLTLSLVGYVATLAAIMMAIMI